MIYLNRQTFVYKNLLPDNIAPQPVLCSVQLIMLGFKNGFLILRQSNSRKNADDKNYHKQFYQSKTFFVVHKNSPHPLFLTIKNGRYI
jgi:hypothetical protein